MTKPEDDRKAAKRFDVSVDTRKFEIELFWKRSLFFWGFIAVAFIGYGALTQAKAPDLAHVMACFGLVCSVAWTLANRGSKYWQEAWEQKVEREERDVLGGPFFSVVEPVQTWKGSWLRARRYSVSKLTIALSDFTALVWFIVTVKSLINAPNTFTIIVALLTSGVVVSMFMFARTNDRTPQASG